MTTENLDALFGMYSEAILAVRGDIIAYYNGAARRLLPDNEQMAPNDIFPSAVLELNSDNLVGEIDIAGKRSTYSAARFSEYRIFSVLAIEDNGETLNSAALSAMSLEMKNYLAILKLASGAVLPYVENTGDKRLREYAAMINRSYYNILRLTSNIEALGIGRGAADGIRRSRFDLVQVCREISEACAYLVEDRGLKLSFNCACEEVTISADRDKIEQMLLNMISNSIACTKKGGDITVSVTLSGESALIKVSDTGTGIPCEIRQSVWSRYRQPRELSDVKSGAGFGMAAVSQIARMHGGSMFLESREGAGATVAASIPIVREENLSVRDELAVYRSDGISPILTGLSTVLGYDKFMQKYMD